MKNIKYITIVCVFFSMGVKAQTLVPNYIENAYTLDNQIGGTARYKALGGAMSSLGADFSAIGDNPAGVAVFNTSEIAGTLGINSTNIEVPGFTDSYGTRTATSESNTKLKFDQLGGVLFIENGDETSKWKSFSLGVNYQNIGIINETISVGRDTGVFDPSAGKTFNGYTVDTKGSNFRTNLALGANYDNTLYIGGSLDLYHSNKQISNNYSEEVNGYTYNYIKADSPLTENSTGFGLSLGLIYKPIQQVRLGISYKSPVWWSVDRTTPFYEEYSYTNAGVTTFTRELSNFTSNTYDLTTPQTLNLGAAYVFAKKGLISVDYSLKDYKGTSFRPSGVFSLENQYIGNVFQSTSTIKLGAEYRLNEIFTLRGGYRYQQSPYNHDKLLSYADSSGYSTSYYGDTKGISLGLGIKFSKAVYLDAAYNYLTRDRELLIYGEHYDITTGDSDPNNLIANFSPGANGLLTIQNITEVNHNVSLTLGVKF